MKDYSKVINDLDMYLEDQNYMGYDPYDALLSKYSFLKFGKWSNIFITQLLKRLPINLRPILGIPKGYNPKAMGLFLHAYSLLYIKYNKERYKKKCSFFFDWLKKNYSSGYSGYCWGYNFPWSNPVKKLEPYIPSSVVTAMVCRGIFTYYMATKDKNARSMLIDSSKFILTDLPTFQDHTGICISYTPIQQDICYNASLLAGEVLAINYSLTQEKNLKEICLDVVDFVISRQNEDGSWFYSQNNKGDRIRKQIDFHQGFILESILRIKKSINVSDRKWDNAINKGLSFYAQKQFFPNGQSLWRLPKKYPADIHFQSQGIITFTLLKDYLGNQNPFAFTIAKWTITNMLSPKGFFYYRYNRLFTNKISFVRWGQAWMMLGLVTLIFEHDK